ncbi:MAG: putative Ig domain-containing protein, partial [Desulfobacterales bacterium]|nr:putative Ig domain-containing protein [Desulfobacterales bacterium]
MGPHPARKTQWWLAALTACLLGAEISAATMTFTLGSTNGTNGAQVAVPVRVSGFTNILLFQYSLHWDTNVSKYLGVEQFGLPGLTAANFGTADTNRGTLRLSWDDTEGLGKSVADSTVVFAVRFLLVGTPGTSGVFRIDGIPMPMEASDVDYNPVGITSIPGQLGVNAAPVLAAIGNRAVSEGSLLSFVATATDVDVPTQVLSFSLSNAPAGAAMTTNGAFAWTPTEGQGPDEYSFAVVVSDGEAVDSETITVTVGEVNAAPALAAIPEQIAVVGQLWSFTNAAADGDIPSNPLIYSLLNAPAGLSVDTNAGVLAWTPA